MCPTGQLTPCCPRSPLRHCDTHTHTPSHPSLMQCSQPPQLISQMCHNVSNPHPEMQYGPTMDPTLHKRTHTPALGYRWWVHKFGEIEDQPLSASQVITYSWSTDSNHANAAQPSHTPIPHPRLTASLMATEHTT